jgi:hypothetical protein
MAKCQKLAVHIHKLLRYTLYYTLLTPFTRCYSVWHDIMPQNYSGRVDRTAAIKDDGDRSSPQMNRNGACVAWYQCEVGMGKQVVDHHGPAVVVTEAMTWRREESGDLH